MDLAKKRAAVKEHHDKLAYAPQSPLHPNNLKGETPYGDRPIAFICDDEIVVLGEDAQKIVVGLQAFITAVEANAASWALREAREPWIGQALAKIRKLLAAPPTGELRVIQQIWNGYMMGLAEVGVQVILTDGSNEALGG